MGFVTGIVAGGIWLGICMGVMAIGTYQTVSRLHLGIDLGLPGLALGVGIWAFTMISAKKMHDAASLDSYKDAERKERARRNGDSHSDQQTALDLALIIPKVAVASFLASWRADPE